MTLVVWLFWDGANWCCIARQVINSCHNHCLYTGQYRKEPKITTSGIFLSSRLSRSRENSASIGQGAILVVLWSAKSSVSISTAQMRTARTLSPSSKQESLSQRFVSNSSTWSRRLLSHCVDLLLDGYRPALHGGRLRGSSEWTLWRCWQPSLSSLRLGHHSLILHCRMRCLPTLAH